MKTFLTLAAVAAFTFPAAQAIAGDYGNSYGDKEAKAEKMMNKDIVDTAASLPEFSTLVAAVQAAGLVDALKGDGPLTVFAPTNDAFAALPEGTVDNLLKPENKEQLQAILKYHVVSGKIKSGDIAEGSSDVTTLQGSTANVVKSETGVTIDGANVVKADVKTSNGIIHVIDKVILPE
jgi:uncharacterized surface protein with fasciclin (FAS1) repeats